MTNNSRRRWLRFSLRSLFVVITLACVWLGWQTSIVQTRWRLLEELEQQTGTSAISYNVAPMSFPGQLLGQETEERVAKYGPGALRRLLGDQAYYVIVMPQPLDPSNEHDSAPPEFREQFRERIRQRLHAVGDPYQKAFPETVIVIAQTSEGLLALEEVDALFADGLFSIYNWD